jgi:hypothetical protein
MYDMMNQKMTEYSTNEMTLINNVRNTILKTFEKEQKTKSILEKNMEFCQNQLDLIKKSTEKSINFYKDLNSNIKKEVDTLKADMTRLNK